MGRMSARFIANEIIGYTTASVYKLWEEMGLVYKDKFGDWALTGLGIKLGGKMSKSNYNPVPTFDADKVIDLMDKFIKTGKL